MKKISNLLYKVTSPCLFPLLGLFIVFHSSSIFSRVPHLLEYYSYFLISVAFILIPLAVYLLLNNLSRKINISNNDKKIYLLGIVIITGFIAFGILQKLPNTLIIVQQFCLVTVVLGSILALISLYWKISVNMAAWGFLCAICAIFDYKYLGNTRFLLTALILFSGVTASNILYLNKNNILQITSGYFLGLFVVLVLMG